MPTDQDRRSDDEPGLLDEVADRLGFRARLKRNPALALAYRIGVAVVGDRDRRGSASPSCRCPVPAG